MIDPTEQEWLEAAANNPAFNFLKDPAEDIYFTTDGRPYDAGLHNFPEEPPCKSLDLHGGVSKQGGGREPVAMLRDASPRESALRCSSA